MRIEFDITSLSFYAHISGISPCKSGIEHVCIGGKKSDRCVVLDFCSITESSGSICVSRVGDINSQFN